MPPVTMRVRPGGPGWPDATVGGVGVEIGSDVGRPEGWIDDRRQVDTGDRVVAQQAAVHGPADALGPPLAHLVGHGVAERLHRVVTVDLVAVAVEQGVDLPEGERPVALQEALGEVAEGGAGDGARGARQGGQPALTRFGRATAPATGFAGPQPVVEREAFGEPDVAGDEPRGRLLVEPGEGGDDLSAFGLEPGPLGLRKGGLAPQGVVGVADAAQRRRRE